VRFQPRKDFHEKYSIVKIHRDHLTHLRHRVAALAVQEGPGANSSACHAMMQTRMGVLHHHDHYYLRAIDPPYGGAYSCYKEVNLPDIVTE
jgi:hypothetical protein